MLNSLLCLRGYQARAMVRIDCLLLALLCWIDVSESAGTAVLIHC